MCNVISVHTCGRRKGLANRSSSLAPRSLLRLRGRIQYCRSGRHHPLQHVRAATRGARVASRRAWKRIGRAPRARSSPPPTAMAVPLALDVSTLCDAIAREPKAASQPRVVGALGQVLAALDSGGMAVLVHSLCGLALSVLEGLPFRLPQMALQVLVHACDRAWHGVSRHGPNAADQQSMLEAAAPLWARGLAHQNREVRACTLALLARMLSHAALRELPPGLIDAILRTGVVVKPCSR